jgi:hypothetical protein
MFYVYIHRCVGFTFDLYIYMNNKVRTVMSKKEEPDEFRCSKCKIKFRGLDSFHGEYRVWYGNVKNIQLCMKVFE